MTNLLSRLFGRARKGSGATAKDRLRFVLQHDRINLPPERMEEMKREILAVIVKYLVVDKDRVEIDLEQRDRTHSKLVAEIPVAINTPSSAHNEGAKPALAGEEAQAKAANNGADAEENEADAKPAEKQKPQAAKDEKADEREKDQPPEGSKSKAD